MVVTIEGIVLDIQKREKDEKTVTDVQIHQDGERELITCRLEGDRENDFDKYQLLALKGRLVLWKQREGVGKMVLVEEILQ